VISRGVLTSIQQKSCPSAQQGKHTGKGQRDRKPANKRPIEVDMVHTSRACCKDGRAEEYKRRGCLLKNTKESRHIPSRKEISYVLLA